MSGGRFLVSLKDVLCSEKIFKIKSLVKGGINIDENVKIKENQTDDLQALLSRFESRVGSSNSIRLSEGSRDISDYIAGHIAYKTKSFTTGCCSNELVMSDPTKSDNKYIDLMSRGGLTYPSEELGNLVARGFAILDVGADIIRQSSIQSRTAGVREVSV